MQYNTISLPLLPLHHIYSSGNNSFLTLSAAASSSPNFEYTGPASASLALSLSLSTTEADLASLEEAADAETDASRDSADVSASEVSPNLLISSAADERAAAAASLFAFFSPASGPAKMSCPGAARPKGMLALVSASSGSLGCSTGGCGGLSYTILGFSTTTAGGT